MSLTRRSRFALLASVLVSATLATAAAQQAAYPKPAELPNPYRLVEGWPTLPASMNHGHWGEVIRVHVAHDGNVWVFHRCFNTVPPGSAVCINRGAANPPILEFDPSGKLLKSFGAGLFAYPHGFTVDPAGNLWVTDVNDAETVLGMSAKNADGVVMGQEVMKLSPDGKVLMMLGKEGVAGNGPDTFDRPTGVAIAPNGDIFVTDGHNPNAHKSARVVKFSKDGHFIKTWGREGSAPGDFQDPHDIFIGGSRTACTSQTAGTIASRFSIRMASSSPRGRNSARQALSSSARTTRSMSAPHLLIPPPREARTQGHRGRRRHQWLAQGLHSGSCRPRQVGARLIRVGHRGR